jgi:hypothetical protein
VSIDRKNANWLSVTMMFPRVNLSK